MPASGASDSGSAPPVVRDKWYNSVRGCLAAQEVRTQSQYQPRSPQARGRHLSRGSSGSYHPSAAVGARRPDGMHAHRGSTRAAYALFEAGDAGAHPSWRFLHRFACAFGEASYLAQLALPAAPSASTGTASGNRLEASSRWGYPASTAQLTYRSPPRSRAGRPGLRADPFSVQEDRQNLPPPALVAYTVALLAAVLTRNDTPLVVVRGVVDACFGLAPSWRRRHAAAAAARRFARMEQENVQKTVGEEFATGGGEKRRSRMASFLRADDSFGDLAAAWEAESAAGSVAGTVNAGVRGMELVSPRTSSPEPYSPGRSRGHASRYSSSRSFLAAIQRVAEAREPPSPQLAPFFLQPNSVFRLLRWAVGAPRARSVLQTLGVDAPSPARVGDRIETLGPAAMAACEGACDGYAGIGRGLQRTDGSSSSEDVDVRRSHRTAVLLSAAHAGLLAPQDRHALRLVDPWTSWHALKLRRTLVAKRADQLRSRLLGDDAERYWQPSTEPDSAPPSGGSHELLASPDDELEDDEAPPSPPPVTPGERQSTSVTLAGFAMMNSPPAGSGYNSHDAESAFFPRMRRKQMQAQLDRLRLQQLAEADEDLNELSAGKGSPAISDKRIGPDSVHTMLTSGQWKRYGGIRLPRSERLGSGRRLLTTDEAQEYVLISLLNKASGSRYGALAGDDEAGPQDIGGGSGVLGLRYRQVGVNDIVSSSEDEGSGSESDGGSSGLRRRGKRGVVDQDVADALPPAQGRLLAFGYVDSNEESSGTESQDGGSGLNNGIRPSPSAPSLSYATGDSFRHAGVRARSSSAGTPAEALGSHAGEDQPNAKSSRARYPQTTREGRPRCAMSGLDSEHDSSVLYDLLLALSKFGGPWLLSSPVLTGAVTQLQVSAKATERTFLLQLLHSLYNPRPRDLRGWSTWRKRRLRAKKTESVAPGGRSVGRPATASIAADGMSVASGFLPPHLESSGAVSGQGRNYRGLISVRSGTGQRGSHTSLAELEKAREQGLPEQHLMEDLTADRPAGQEAAAPEWPGLPGYDASDQQGQTSHSSAAYGYSSEHGSGCLDEGINDMSGELVGLSADDWEYDGSGKGVILRQDKAQDSTGASQTAMSSKTTAAVTTSDVAKSPRALRGLLRPSTSPPPRSPSMSALSGMAHASTGLDLQLAPSALDLATAAQPRARTPPATPTGNSSVGLVAKKHSGSLVGYPSLPTGLPLSPPRQPADTSKDHTSSTSPGLALSSPSHTHASRESSLDEDTGGDEVTKLPTSFGPLAGAGTSSSNPASRRYASSGSFTGSLGRSCGDTDDGGSSGGYGWEGEDESDAEGSDDDDREEAEEQRQGAQDVARRHLDRFLAMWRSRVVCEVAAAITKRVRVTSLAVQYAMANESKLPESLLRTGPDSMLSLADSDSDEEDEAVVVSASGGLGVARTSSGDMTASEDDSQGGSTAGGVPSEAGRSQSPAPWHYSTPGASSGSTKDEAGSVATGGSTAVASRVVRRGRIMRRVHRGSVSLASGLGILDSDTGVVIKPASDVQVGSMRELLAFCGQAIASYRPGLSETAGLPRELGSGVSPIPLPARTLGEAIHSPIVLEKGSAFSARLASRDGNDSVRVAHPLRRVISGETSQLRPSRIGDHSAGTSASSSVHSYAGHEGRGQREASDPNVSSSSPHPLPATRYRSNSDADADARAMLAVGLRQELHQTGDTAGGPDAGNGRTAAADASLKSAMGVSAAPAREAATPSNTPSKGNRHPSSLSSGAFSSRHFAAVGPGRLVVAVAHCLVRLGPVVCGEYSSVLRCATAAAAADAGAARYLAGTVLLRWPRNASTRQILLLRFLATTLNSWAFSHEGQSQGSMGKRGGSKDARRHARMLARAGGAARRALEKAGAGSVAGVGPLSPRDGRDDAEGPPSCMDEQEGSYVPEVGPLRERLIRRLCVCIQSPHAQLATAAAALCHPQPHTGEPSPLVPLILGDSTFTALVLSAFQGPALQHHWNSTVKQNARVVAQAIAGRAKEREVERARAKEARRRAGASAVAGQRQSSPAQRSLDQGLSNYRRVHATSASSAALPRAAGARRLREGTNSTVSDSSVDDNGTSRQVSCRDAASPAYLADTPGSRGADKSQEKPSGSPPVGAPSRASPSTGESSSIRRGTARRHSSPALAALMG